MQRFLKPHMVTDQKGAVAAIIAICLVVFVGITAFAVDIGHLYVVRNELQNAADAGALAGASALFKKDGSINDGANAIALKAANENTTETGGANPINAEVASTGAYIVRRGHWSFATKTFTPNDSLTQTDLWNVTELELDADPGFINAVRVYTERKVAPVGQWFGKILGKENQEMQTVAVAYIGFAGTLYPLEADVPIAICKEAITEDDKYDCGEGRMSNSNKNVCDSNTTAWTDFEQPCSGSANANTMKDLACGDGNPVQLTFGQQLEITNGVQDVTFRIFRDCWWKNSANGTKPWAVTMPVINCFEYPGTLNCAKDPILVGAAEVNIMWVQEKANNCLSQDNKVPTENYPTSMSDVPGYADWTAPVGATPAQIWQSFFNHFKIQNSTLDPACQTVCDKKTIYLLPDCKVHEPTGNTGGRNYGVLAKIPVLVN